MSEVVRTVGLVGAVERGGAAMVRVDVDGSVEVAWRAFEHRLAADLVELGRGGALQLGVPTGGAGPSPLALQFRARPATILMTAGGPCRDGDGSLRTGIPPAGVPSTKTFRVGEEPAIAAWATRVLRDAYGVLHPAFLAMELTDADGEPVVQAGLARHGLGAGAVRGVVLPATPDELDDLVQGTLASVVSAPVVRDADGDIPLAGAYGTAYVRTRRDCPAVEVFAVLTQLDESDDVAVVTEALNARNARSSVETFFVVNNHVVVRTAVMCLPYQPTLLLAAIDAVMLVLEQAAAERPYLDGPRADLAKQDPTEVDAGVEDASLPARGEIATELLTILQLSAAGPDTVSPRLAAQIFRNDPDRLLAGIREAELEVISWRRSIDAARVRDDDEAVVCAGEVSACSRRLTCFAPRFASPLIASRGCQGPTNAFAHPQVGVGDDDERGSTRTLARWTCCPFSGPWWQSARWRSVRCTSSSGCSASASTTCGRTSTRGWHDSSGRTTRSSMRWLVSAIVWPESRPRAPDQCRLTRPTPSGLVPRRDAPDPLGGCA